MFDIDASKARRASAICRAASGEGRDDAGGVDEDIFVTDINGGRGLWSRFGESDTEEGEIDSRCKNYFGICCSAVVL